MSKKDTYHIIPNQDRGGWDIKREGAVRSSGHFDRKADAMDHARKLARTSNLGLVEHGRNGRIFGSETPKGYGSLMGAFTIRRGLDVRKPIFEQAINKKK